MGSGSAWFVLAVGVVMAVVTYVWMTALLRIRRRTRDWVCTQGVVTGHETVSTSATNDEGIPEQQRLRFCLYRFTDSAGKVHDGKGGGAGPAKGQTIRVKYDPQAPQNSQTVGVSRAGPALTIALVALSPVTVFLLQWGIAGVLGVEPVVGFPGS